MIELDSRIHIKVEVSYSVSGVSEICIVCHTWFYKILLLHY